MSILTKISIVLLVVLVLPTSVVIVQQASQLPSYMDAFERRGTELESVNQANKHLQLALKQAQDQGNRHSAAAATAVAEKRNLRETLQARINDLVAEKLAMAGELAELTTALQGLNESLKTEIAGRARLRGELNVSRAQTNKLKDHVNQLNAALRDKEVAIARLERTVQKFREDIVIKEKEIIALQKVVETMGRPAAATDGLGRGVVPDVPRIQGTITAIDNDVASINIGSAKGIKKGMRLIVFREDNFVAHLQIELVDLNNAAGVIVNKRLEPRKTDKVKTRGER